MKTSNCGLKMLTVSAPMMGKIETIHPTLIWDDTDVILIDTAYPGQLALLSSEIANARSELSIEQLSKILITHQDIDHIGCLPAILANNPNKFEVLASQVEKPYIQGDKMLLRLTPDAIDQAVNAMPASVPEEWKNAFRHTLENPPRASIDTIIAGDEELPFCGGITIIDTPGHTPGHISIYHQQSRTLIAGDAMVVVDGELFGPSPQEALDLVQANQSLRAFARYDIQSVICHHGGLYVGNCNTRIAEILSTS